MSALGNSVTVVALPLIAVDVLDADSTAVGLLAQAFGAVAGLLADAVTFLISAVCVQRMRVVEPDHTPGAERAPSDGRSSKGCVSWAGTRICGRWSPGVPRSTWR